MNQTALEPTSSGSLHQWLVALRPRHWLKNSFVLAPILFAEKFAQPAAILAITLAFAAFCLASSAGYLLNDVLDRVTDAQHPRKRRRPIAAGHITPGTALVVAALLAMGSLAVAALDSLAVTAFVAAYLANTVLYALLLRHRVIIDVIAIAIGFVLRLLAGCAALDVTPSSWLVICGFSLALVLGFGKRRVEVSAADVTPEYRSALVSYSEPKLDTLLAVTAAVCLLAYMLFTTAPDTVARHGTDRLIYTVPLVAYGLFRYIFKVQEARHDGPTEVITTDPIFAITGLIWGIACAAILLLS